MQFDSDLYLRRDDLDTIDTILQQFMDYAGSGAKETPIVGDLNALVANLAADFAGLGHEFALDLGAIEPFPFRPISMMRILMNLMQNAVLYGVVGLEVRTWTDTQAKAACVVIADRGKGLEALAEDGPTGPLEKSLKGQPGIVHVGSTDTPVGARSPGDIGPGDAFEFKVTAKPGERLTIAAMFAQSNDLFYAPREEGIVLFDASGKPVAGDITSAL